MKTTLLATVAAASMFLAFSQANAADIVPENSLGMYVSVFGGASFLNDVKVNYLATATGTSSSAKLNMKAGYLLGGAIGVQVTDMVRGEVELSHSSWKGKSYTYATSGGSTGGGRLSGHISATYLLANVWVDLKNDSAFTPYAGGGLGAGWVNSNLGGVIGDGIGTNFAFQLGAGVKYAFSDNVSVDLGYRYKSIQNVDFKNTGGGINNFKGDDINSHNIQLGLTYSF